MGSYTHKVHVISLRFIHIQIDFKNKDILKEKFNCNFSCNKNQQHMDKNFSDCQGHAVFIFIPSQTYRITIKQ